MSRRQAPKHFNIMADTTIYMMLINLFTFFQRGLGSVNDVEGWAKSGKAVRNLQYTLK